MRLFGLAAMAAGAAGWWYNEHLAATEGAFWIKLCVFVPLALAGGLLMLVRPEYAGPWRQENSRSHKAAVIAVVAFMAVGSGIEFYRLQQIRERHTPKQTVIRWTPEMGRPPATVQRPSYAVR